MATLDVPFCTLPKQLAGELGVTWCTFGLPKSSGPMTLIPEFRKHAAKRKGQTHCQAGHRIAGQLSWQELQRDEAAKFSVLGL